MAHIFKVGDKVKRPKKKTRMSTLEVFDGETMNYTSDYFVVGTADETRVGLQRADSKSVIYNSFNHSDLEPYETEELTYEIY